MSDDFKRKLMEYKDGKLSGEERAEVERELAKMETYQAYLDEMLENEAEEEHSKQPMFGNPSDPAEQVHRNEKRLLRRGRWKLRFGTLMTLLSLFIWFTFISAIGSAVYFSKGNPDLTEVNKDVVESAIAVGYPNTGVHLSGSTGMYFNMKASGKMVKRVGDEPVEVGEVTASFLFGWMRLSDISWSANETPPSGVFFYPGFQAANSDSQWRKLEKLPEGTVAEAYVSYKKLYTTDEFLSMFSGKRIDPVWFAVDNGAGTNERYGGMIMNPVGFPSLPVWHRGRDGEETKTSKNKGLVTQTTSVISYPAVNVYGDGEIRDKNFIDTLRILAQHKRAAKRLIPSVDMEATLEYVEKNGVKIYGAVVTGPTKEVLKLRQDPSVSAIHVGRVALWNLEDEQ